jgi:hypothetical protein
MPAGHAARPAPATEVWVTNLNPTGAGSLRDVLHTLPAGPDVAVKFSVAGTIDMRGLSSPTQVRRDGVLIAGETAPWPGITIIGAHLEIRASRVEVRHLRTLPGDQGGPAPVDRDGIRVGGGFDVPIEDIYVHHCSFGFSIDELASLFNRPYERISRLTLADNIMAEPLDDSIHPEGKHGLGVLVGSGSTDILVYRNFLAHIRDRVPACNHRSRVAIVNNLTYNANKTVSFYATPKDPAGPTHLRVEGNLHRLGNNKSTAAFSWLNGTPAAGSTLYRADNATVVSPALLAAKPWLAGLDAFPASAYDVATPNVDLPAGLEVLRAADLEASLLRTVGPCHRTIWEDRIIAEAMDGALGGWKNTVPAAEAAFFGF